MTNTEEPARAHPALDGAGERLDAEAAEALRRRRAAIDELGDALRLLVERSVATEAPVEDLLATAALVREARVALDRHPRAREQMPSADDLLGGVRMYNPVSGSGSAFAPPLRMASVDGEVVGTCTLGLAHEGPPMYVHGGVSAMLLDQLLGYTITAAGHPGMTVSLATQYRAPVPLLAPLRLTGRVTEVSGRKVTAYGVIATAEQPDRPLVEATGIFVALSSEQAMRLFAAALDMNATDPSVAHD